MQPFGLVMKQRRWRIWLTTPRDFLVWFCLQFLLGKSAIVCHDTMTVAGIIDFATVADQGSGYGVTSVTHPQMWLSL